MPDSDVDGYLAGLARMANQIAENCGEQGAAGVVEHMQRFWDPQMRNDLIAAVEGGALHASDTVRAAVGQMAKALKSAGAGQPPVRGNR